MRRSIYAFLLAATLAYSQVHSPVVTKRGQADTSTLPNLVRDIYAESGAKTPRQKAEAIWRFFLTDGRFAKPSLIYHIAGWAYEEPKGEVLDPLKLLNSYGFGLCYHIAPLLEAVFESGGFEDARVWFLTGHTVAEVFYDGKYHYFDSDMLGFNNTDHGVASVHDIEKNGRIVTEQLKRSDHGEPWYPADVRENAIGGLAELFTTSKDNWVYPFQRYSSGHTMDFTLRPGERMIRNFFPASDRLFYLPFAQQPDGTWAEFPREIAQYNIKTQNGPRSQKDNRLWGTGRLEYRPQALPADGVIPVTSPYVVIGAAFDMHANVAQGGSITVDTSTDDGKTWKQSASLSGPFDGPLHALPATVAKGANGALNAVSGSYGYLVRIRAKAATVRDVLVATDFAVNPRSLPTITAGRNEMQVRTANLTRRTVHIDPATVQVANGKYEAENGQGYVRNTQPQATPGTITLQVSEQDLRGFDIGARFLDLRDGLAPDKYTAEVRQVKPWPANVDRKFQPKASIEWSKSSQGPWNALWTYDAALSWRDGEPIDRTLRWPEVDRQVRDASLPSGKPVYVRLSFDGMAVDDIRLATYSRAAGASPLQVTHVWRENGTERRHTHAGQASYVVDVPADAKIENLQIVLECPVRPN